MATKDSSRLLCICVFLIAFSSLGDSASLRRTSLMERDGKETWATDEDFETTEPTNKEVPCQGQLCLYGNRQLARRKVLKRKTVCGPSGCFLSPKSSDIDQELDSAELDSYGIEYNNLNKRAPCQGQMCWFRGKRGKLSTKEIKERLESQLSFLQDLNKRQQQNGAEKRTANRLGCTGQMCWFRGKRNSFDLESGKQKRSPCVGQMCWFRGKRITVIRQSKPCVGQMCWFRGKREGSSEANLVKEVRQAKKQCTGLSCGSRGDSSLQSLKRNAKKREQGDAMCTGQMCWFRGRKEIQNERLGCKGQMCWFRGKRDLRNKNKELL